MLAMTRQVLIDLLLEIPALVDRYQAQDPGFVPAAVSWMERAETDLGRLRHPAAAFVAARRSLVLAASDGHRLPGVDAPSGRKAVRASAAVLLSEIEHELQRNTEQIDDRFGEMTERMAQLVAVAMAGGVIPDRREPREAWLRDAWASLDAGNGSQGLHQFLQAQMAPADRLFVLDDVLANALG